MQVQKRHRIRFGHVHELIVHMLCKTKIHIVFTNLIVLKKEGKNTAYLHVLKNDFPLYKLLELKK